MASSELIRQSRGKMLWVPYSGLRWPPPRLVQLVNIVVCRFKGHDFDSPYSKYPGGWRRETEEWFEYVPRPMPWAWRICSRCQLSEHCRGDVSDDSFC